MLEIESTKGPRTFYKPALLKIAGVSQYNAEQVRFEGVEDYWQFGEIGLRSVKEAFDLEEPRVPPVGTIAWFSLATNPKTGKNAKPGSMYRDINKVTRATDEEKAAYVTPEATGGDYVEKELGGADTQPSYWEAKERDIRLGMAFNNLTHMLANSKFDNGINSGVDVEAGFLGLWNKWFSEASRGLPLTPVQDEQTSGAVEDAAEMDQQVEQMDF